MLILIIKLINNNVPNVITGMKSIVKRNVKLPTVKIMILLIIFVNNVSQITR